MEFKLPSDELLLDLYDSFPMRKLESLGELDYLMARGYRFLGLNFLRDTATYRPVGEETISIINIPLRIDLEFFSFSKSQLSLLKKNKEKFDVHIHTANWTSIKTQLFIRYRKERFEMVYTPSVFIPQDVSNTPTPCIAFDVYEKNRKPKKLRACSMIHLAELGISGTFCMYDLRMKQDSLGYFTQLLEIEYALQNGYKYYYLGNTQNFRSIFDYKLNFEGLEALNWNDLLWVKTPRIPIGEVTPKENNYVISDWVKNVFI
jgi:leucyl-tRNA---protein transferase